MRVANQAAIAAYHRYKPHYDLRWAEKIVRKFCERYTRATELFCQITGLTSQEMVIWLASCDPYWEQAKTIIKLLEDSWLSQNSDAVDLEKAILHVKNRYHPWEDDLINLF